MAIGTDFEIQADKDIRYVGASHGASGAGYYSVLEFHRWLGGLADDSAATGDDLLDMAKDTPSDKAFDTIVTLINGYNIDDTAAEHLYGGSIIQTGGDVIYDGVQVIAGSGAHVEIQQNGAMLANDFWNSIPFGTGIKGLNPDASNGIASRFMLKVRTGGADIDGRRFILITREFGFTYSEFKINGSSRGINVAALTYAVDLNNATAEATVATWSDVTNLTEGYNGIDVNADSTNEFYYSKWDKGSRTINQAYERLKWLTRRGSSSTLYGLNGEVFRGITHEITVDTPSVTDFSAVEAVSWSGGTGRMLAVNDVNAPTRMWIQLLTGVPPTDNQTITGGTSGATCLVNVTVTERPLSFPFCGVSTGSALIGSFGLGFEAADLSQNDKVFDLTNTLRQAPNNVTFTVSGLVVGEDAVLVGPATGSALNTTQFTLNGALTGAAVTAVVVVEAIPADTPPTGTLRILRANGATSKHAYTSFNGGTKTFTIGSTNFSTNNAANGTGAYLGYIDKVAAATSETFTVIYSADRQLFIRVRDGGVTPIKTFETVGTLTNAGGSVNAIRTPD